MLGKNAINVFDHIFPHKLTEILGRLFLNTLCRWMSKCAPSFLLELMLVILSRRSVYFIY
jgi:hypothetical protein